MLPEVPSGQSSTLRVTEGSPACCRPRPGAEVPVPASPQSLPRGQAGSQALCYAAGTRGLREAEERPEAVPAARTRAQPQHHHLRAGRLHGAPQRRFPTAGILHVGGSSVSARPSSTTEGRAWGQRAQTRQ